MRQRSLTVWLGTIAIVATPSLSSHAKERLSKPNIVIVLADDLDCGDVSFLNPEFKVQTPHMDAPPTESWDLGKEAGPICTRKESPQSPSGIRRPAGATPWMLRLCCSIFPVTSVNGIICTKCTPNELRR